MLFRLARAVAGAVLAGWLLYLGAMNVFLSTSLFAKLVDGKPDTIDIWYGHGWSWTPGHIHARDLAIRGRDGNIEWILRLDDVQFDVDLKAFAARRFQANHVHGRGISFRVRQRLEAPPKSPDEVADLPPIEGLGPYAVKPPPEFDPGEWDDRYYRLWSAHLEDVVADDVREIWIDHVRFQGQMRITGRFDFRPQRLADVGPVHLAVHDGDARRGDDVIVDHLGGATADVTTWFDPRTAHGLDLVRTFDIQARLSARCPDVDRLRIGWPADVTVHGEVDARRLSIALHRGVLQGGTGLDAVGTGVAERHGHHFRATLAVGGDVSPSPAGPRFGFHGDLTGLGVARDGGALFVSVPRATVDGDARALDLADLLSDVHLVVDVPSGDLPDASALSPYIPAETPLALLAGRGHVSTHLETWRAERRARGNAELQADGLDVRVGSMRIQGTTAASASFGEYSWATSRATDAKLSLHIAEGTLAADRAPATPLVRVSGLGFDTSASEVLLDDPLRSLHATISMKSGDLVDPDLLRAYVPSGPGMRIRPHRAQVSLAAELAIENHLASGTVDLGSKGLGFDFEDFSSSIDVTAKARVHDWQWESGRAVLDEATIDIANAAIQRMRGHGGDERGRSECRDGSPDDPRCLALSFGRIRLAARSDRFEWTDPLARIHLAALLEDAQVHDPGIVNAFLPKDVPFSIRGSDGGFSSEVTADVDNHVLRGSIGLHAHGLGVGGDTLSLVGDVDMLAHVAGVDFDKHTLSVADSRVTFTHVTGDFRHAARPEGRSDFQADEIELQATVPVFDLERPSMQGVDGRVRIAGAALPDARTLQRFLPGEGVVQIESGSAHVSGDLEVSSTARSGRGALDVQLPRGGLRLHETHLVGDFRLSVVLCGYAPDTGSLDISGSRLALRDVAVTHASTDTARWQGDVTLRRGTLRFDPQPELEAAVALEARDASPILAVLLGNGLPKFLVGLTSMPHLTGIAGLTMGPGRVAVRDVHLRGGDISLDGIYVVGEDHRAGGFVFGKGPLSAGFHLDDEGVHVRLFGLDGWLRDETRSALQVLGQATPAAASPQPPR